MTELTSAEAAKVLKKLNEELNSITQGEEKRKSFLAALGEDPESVRPQYDYEDTSKKIDKIEMKIRLLKHAINLFNITTVVPKIGLTVDQTLIYIPQLTKKCNKLWEMLNKLPKTREIAAGYGHVSSIIDYRYVNYNIEQVKHDYYKYKEDLDSAQLQLDLVNSTLRFPIEEWIIQ